MKRREKQIVVEGREIRFTNFIDSKSLQFESEALKLISNAAIEQTLVGFTRSQREFFIMQMRGKNGTPVMQACVHIGRPRFFPGFSIATVPKLWLAEDSEDEEIGLGALRKFCKENPEIMTLRLQPQRFEWRALMDFQAHGIRQGYQVANPVSVVRTRIIDLENSADEFASKLPSRTKAHFRHRGREKIETRQILGREYLEICRAAATASRQRSGSDRSSYDFEMAFDLAASDPGRAHIVGLFFKDRPDELMAYVIGFRRGNLLEYSSAGSFSNYELRGIPFNYFLLWDLMAWGRSQGCTRMDMGGVTDGGPTDPLRGIAQFKRSFPGEEIESGREMLAVLRPVRFGVYRLLKHFQMQAAQYLRRMRNTVSVVSSRILVKTSLSAERAISD